jgi:hypothetical protein
MHKNIYSICCFLYYLKNYYEIKTKNKNYQFSYFLENELLIKAKNEN